MTKHFHIMSDYSNYKCEVIDNKFNTNEEWLIKGKDLDFTKILVYREGLFIQSLKNKAKFYIIHENNL